MLKPQLQNGILHSIKWAFLESLFVRGFSLLVKLFLARLLLPESFGIIGMAAVFISLLEVLAEMGMTQALIQLDEKKICSKHWDTAFTISIITATLGFFTICATSPLVATFYNEPALQQVFPALGLSLIFNALAITQKARLQRGMEFKKISLIAISTTIASSIVAIGMALSGFGVWALVAKVLLSSGLKSICMWLIYPTKYHLKFHKKQFREIFSFGSYVTINNCMFFLTNNIDYLLIGKILGSSTLGIYTLAFTLTDTLRKQVMGTFNKVMFPVFSKMQHDKEVMAEYYLKIVKYNMLIIVPIMLLLILEAPTIINTLFGNAWIEAVTPVKILSFAVIVHTLGGTSATLLHGAGFARLVMNIELIKLTLITTPAMLIGAITWGTNGAAFAVLIHKSIGRIIYFLYIRKIFLISFNDLCKVVVPVVLPTVAMLIMNKVLVCQLQPIEISGIIRGGVELLAFAFIALFTFPELQNVKKIF